MTTRLRCNAVRSLTLALCLLGFGALGTEEEPEARPALRALLSDLDLLEAKKLVHARKRLFDTMLERCRTTASSQTKLPADDSGTCAVVFSEIATGDPALEARITSLLEGASTSTEQSLYYRARSGLARPVRTRERLVRTLVDWTALERAMPESGEIAYWKAKTLQAANEHSRAEESFAQAEALNNPLAVERRRSHPDLREAIDGLSWGWAPWISVGPAQGLMGGISVFDDRLSDRSQRVRLDVAASTRGSWSARGAFENRDWFRAAPNTELGVSLGGAAGEWIEDYFGRGIDSPKGTRTELRVERADGEMTLFTAWKRTLQLHIGWAIRAARMKKHPGFDVFTAQGPVGKMSWDSRDSALLPRRGIRISVAGFFPSVTLGSARSFERWDLGFESYLPIGKRHVTSLSAVAELGSPRTPFNEHSRVSGSLDVPGLRANRYRDTSSVASFIEHRWHAGEADALSAFVTTVSMAPSLAVRDFKRFKFGGGLAWSHRNERLVSALSRVELGLFDGEFVLQGGLGVSF